MKMKFLYGQASQAVEPVEIRCDKDVRTFISKVKHAPVWPLLYVELIPISPQLSIGGHENIAYKTTYKFNNEVNHYSSTCLSPKCDSLYDTQVPETQDDQFHEGVDVGGDQAAMFHDQEEYE